MNAFTIKDLENLSGVKAHTIRIWEQRYNFLNPQRTDTNIRYYSNDELIRLLNIALLNKYGYKISHIDRMQPEEIQQKLISLTSAEAQQEKFLNDLVACMVNMDIVAFERELNRYIALKGVDKTITQILFPFLEKIGILWITSHINSAQEHLVTNIIRQKIIVGIEHLPLSVQSERSVLLFLPEGEHHELALLYLHYLLRTRGIKVYYLGANVPAKDLAFVVQQKKPDLIYMHVTSTIKRFDIGKFVQFHQQNMSSTKLLMGGKQVQGFSTNANNVMVMKELSEVMRVISGLIV